MADIKYWLLSTLTTVIDELSLNVEICGDFWNEVFSRALLTGIRRNK